MRFVGVFNKDGGTFRTMDMTVFTAEATRVLAEHGHTLECKVVGGRSLVRALNRAAASPDFDAMLVGGGDGTISAAAEVAYKHDRPLAVLPAGTMNLFARALGLPLTLPEALEAIAGGQVSRVDLATANGKPFIHQFGVGIHARLVSIRDGYSYKSSVGKKIASLRAIAAVAMRPPVFDVEMQTRRKVEQVRTSGIAVSNNMIGEGHVPHADTLDGGVLGVYVAEPMSSTALVRLATGVLIGRWKQSSLVSEKLVEHLTLRFPKRKQSAKAVIDGELVKLEREVVLKVHKLALPVIVPIAADDAVAISI